MQASAPVPNSPGERRTATGKYERILLKLSGEVMAGQSSFGVDPDRVRALAVEISEVAAAGVQLGLVVGGGNFFRGVSAAAQHMDRVTADHMGMLATVINALALQDALEKNGVPTRVMTAIEMKAVAEPYIRRRALRHLEKRRVVILAGGTGHPYFSTDTAAALRGVELEVDALLKGTQVDGVYDKDPKRHADARRFAEITFDEVLAHKIQVMDRTAFTLCDEQRLPIVVFEMGVPGNLTRLIRGENVGTLIRHAAAIPAAETGEA